MKILISGASGNIGYEVIRALGEPGGDFKIVAGHYNPEAAKARLSEFDHLEFVKLDLTKPETFNVSLSGVDIVFLLRPPHLADILSYFEPFIQAMKEQGCSRVVFLSVQGVEHQKRIPHYKLEKLIQDNGLDYIFLRPSYFMQNLTTTLVDEIRRNSRIFIPAGKLKMTWVDARDIGSVAASVLLDFQNYLNQSIEITGSEVLGFLEVAQIVSEQTKREITYVNPNLIRFYLTMKKKGLPGNMIFVLIMLHYLPRFSKKPNRLSGHVKEITGKAPGTLVDFVQRTLKTNPQAFSE